MGFKDLKVSNLSLLAKQGWRIITTPNSLLARVFKARYFPRTDFLQAELGQRPSYIWRSFLAGREVLNVGVRYQIGTGQGVHVWKDKWVPLPYNYKVNPINREQWPDLYVNDLIHQHENEWNTQLMSYLFLPHEVQAILQIPLCVEQVQDRICWHFTRNGLYTVKSGYEAFKQYKATFQGDSSTCLASLKGSIWNKLWDLPIQPKIKHFAWRAMYNILPLGDNLSRKFTATVCCPQCGCAQETDKHLFYDCPFSRKVWHLLGLNHFWTKGQPSSMLALLTRLLMVEEEQSVSLFIIAAWLLWKARCAKHFENTQSSQQQIAFSACAMLQEIHNFYKPQDEAEALPATWRKPPVGMVSVNVDASVAVDGTTGYGVLIRDSAGRIVASNAGPLQRHLNVEHAELLAIYHGLLQERLLNLPKPILITDSLLAYNRVTSRQQDYSLLSTLVQQIRLLEAEFESVIFRFVRREGNVPAHLLAKLALSLCNPQHWGSQPPYDVTLAVSLDSDMINE